MTRTAMLPVLFFLGCPAVSDADLEARMDRDGDGFQALQWGGEDCDDDDAATYPGADEVWYDGADQNCDGWSDYDQDFDGYDASEHGGDDCWDLSALFHPGADEYCDGEDNNCNDKVDEDAINATTWYQDSDEDGFGDPTNSVQECDNPGNRVEDGTDCDDRDASIYPGALVEQHGLDLAVVCAGSFAMGSPVGEVGAGTDEGLHQVVLTADLLVGATEVSQAQFAAVTSLEPSQFDACGAECPVEGVSWHLAAAYANALSAANELDSCYSCEGDGLAVSCEPAGAPASCTGYRLPTEAEWEYAARAGSTSAFGGGGSLTEGAEADCSGDLELDDGSFLDDSAWYCGSAATSPAEVGTLDPNAWGLHDMSGNAGEWCHDWYGAYGGDETDPTGPATGTQRVVRGGSWEDEPAEVRVGSRDAAEPGTRSGTIGFRVVRSGW